MPHPTQGQNPITRELAESFVKRIMSGVVKDANGCWIRAVSVNSNGYSHVSRRPNGKRTYYYAHRIMYVATNGPIPDGYTIDHLCEVRTCCNPAHLQAVPHGDNALRGRNNPYAVNARKTHCIRGHELPPYKRGGRRRCRKCAAQYQAALYRRKKEQAA